MARKRTPPRGLLRLFLRAPILLYRCGLGWLLGRRFLMLTHIGRKSGLERRTVLEVVRRNDARGVFVVCSGWGETAQWFRNVIAHPDIWVTSGTRTLPRRARLLPPGDAEAELRDYAARYPRAFRIIARRLLGRTVSGDADFAAMARELPILELGPRPEGGEAADG